MSRGTRSRRRSAMNSLIFWPSTGRGGGESRRTVRNGAWRASTSVSGARSGPTDFPSRGGVCGGGSDLSALPAAIPMAGSVPRVGPLPASPAAGGTTGDAMTCGSVSAWRPRRNERDSLEVPEVAFSQLLNVPRLVSPEEGEVDVAAQRVARGEGVGAVLLGEDGPDLRDGEFGMGVVIPLE